jgi:hypothetical protein
MTKNTDPIFAKLSVIIDLSIIEKEMESLDLSSFDSRVLFDLKICTLDDRRQTAMDDLSNLGMNEIDIAEAKVYAENLLIVLARS